MGTQEFIVWSMALGSIATVMLARLADFAVRRSAGAFQGFAYHLLVLGCVAVVSGMATSGLSTRGVEAAQVLAGPVAVSVANRWLRVLLKATERDRLTDALLRGASWLLPFGAAGCLFLPSAQQLPAAAALSLLGTTLIQWLTVRAAMQGDRLAPALAAGALLGLVAFAGMYEKAMGLGIATPAWQAVFAASAALSNAFVGFALWQRSQHAWLARHAMEPARNPGFDPVTRLASGVALVQKLIRAQRRRRHTRREGALLAVVLYDVEKLAASFGQAAVHEMYITVAGRIQRQVGVVNPVGRYWDRCFVALVETIHSPARLRTLGLRVSTALRRPLAITSPSGERLQVQLDVGVGVVHLTDAPQAVEDILHDAERIAQAARSMRSRAATLDPASGAIVPVENAQLGPRRPGLAGRVRHAV